MIIREKQQLRPSLPRELRKGCCEHSRLRLASFRRPNEEALGFTRHSRSDVIALAAVGDQRDGQWIIRLAAQFGGAVEERHGCLIGDPLRVAGSDQQEGASLMHGRISFGAISTF
jgi:hypothetical protein